MDFGTRSVLPAAYRVLPYDVPFYVPGYPMRAGSRTLAPAPVECGTWYRTFIERILAAKGRDFLPVCRLADGEFAFATGACAANRRHALWRRALPWALARGRRALRAGRFAAQTQGRYHSGLYSRAEWRALRPTYGRQAVELSRLGILAIHLSYGPEPFQESYFPALRHWLDDHGMQLTAHNYVPFYFVYAALTGEQARSILQGRIAVFNGATGAKRDAIVRALLCAGASDVQWVTLSSRRSLFDRVDLTTLQKPVDLALVGAGIGKLNVMNQLQPLGVPCLDAGFVFEVWADARAGAERPYCATPLIA